MAQDGLAGVCGGHGDKKLLVRRWRAARGIVVGVWNETGGVQITDKNHPAARISVDDQQTWLFVANPSDLATNSLAVITEDSFVSKF